MCHHGYEPEDWRAEIEEHTDDEEEEPSFLNEETETEVELLTDGGDGE
jgi:hypothetical protein